MPKIPGFVGPSNEQRARTVDAERTINWFMEQSGAGTPDVQWSLQPTPGLYPYIVLGSGPIRALFYEDGRCFAVSGAWFYEIFPNQTATIRGLVAVDGRMATISSNGAGQGNQLLIISALKGYIYDLVANTLTQITDDAFTPTARSGLFIDGYFIVLDYVTGQFFLSALYDGTSWNGLDFGGENQFSDVVVAMAKTHDNLWLFGTKNTSPWYNNGQASFPFAPIPDSLIEHGTAAEFSAIEIDNTIVWLGEDEYGSRIVWRAQGYTPVRISTHAVEYALAQVPSVQRAVGYGYQQIGHTFYMLYVPGMDTTWTYDMATQQWHERAHWDVQAERWIPHVSITQAYAFGRTLVGARQSGAIYEWRLDTGLDYLVNQ